AESVGYQLKRAQQGLRAAMDRALGELGMTTAQYAALSALQPGEAISGAELARRCFVTPQTMNTIIVTLERGGWVERRAHAEHGRVIETRILPAGIELLRSAHGLVAGVEERMLRGIPASERIRMAAVLARFAENLAGPE
ncbi:MAG TPA: MarR family transcriptional regulator, partial [Longimicrobium sp.]